MVLNNVLIYFVNYIEIHIPIYVKVLNAEEPKK